uniref:Col_cuticle_N domain-containing protein n=1 Tax=Caenorhabditis tropicalis TaxID=1561998 RepID=A0A1I7UA48_9PELO
MGKGKKRKSRDTEQEDTSGESGGKEAYQRPNCCDTFMLALVCFFLVIALAISIPILLTANGSMDIEFIRKKLNDPEKVKN